MKVTNSYSTVKIAQFMKAHFTRGGGVLRVRRSLRFLSERRSPIGTTRHLFSRSVSDISVSPWLS